MEYLTKDSPCFELTNGVCKCIDVYDGDTCTVLVIYPGMTLPVKHQVRLFGIDTPELKPPRDIENRQDIIMKAIQAKQRLSSLVLDKVIEFSIRGKDKYNRLLASLFVDGMDVSQLLIQEGYGVFYDGGKK